jgi:hypothetical protein
MRFPDGKRERFQPATLSSCVSERFRSEHSFQPLCFVAGAYCFDGCHLENSVNRMCLCMGSVYAIRTIPLSEELSLPVVCHCHTLYAASTQAGIMPHGR